MSRHHRHHFGRGRRLSDPITHLPQPLTVEFTSDFFRGPGDTVTRGVAVALRADNNGVSPRGRRVSINQRPLSLGRAALASSR